MMSKRGTYYVAYNDTENEWWVMRRNIGVGMCINKENCQVFADRLNALEAENAELKRDNSALRLVAEKAAHELKELDNELTETIAAVSDLMDENADLSRKLAEVYKSCISAMYSVVMGSASLDTRTAFESAEGAIRALIPKEADHGAHLS